ncbi:MAG: response regulator [Sphingobacteriia bacterium]|nr:MAG: response regulator [Sphingobacteriia bacterium]
MRNTLPLRLYGGLGLSIVLVLLVGFFSINALENQVIETNKLVRTKQTIGTVRDIRYNLLQMRGARRAYWISGNKEHMANFVLSFNTLQPSLLNLKKEVADQPVVFEYTSSLDSALNHVFLFWEQDGKIDTTDSKVKLKYIIEKEESLLKNAYKLFELLRNYLSNQLIAIEKALNESFITSRQIIVGGVVLLITIVVLLVNAVITTLKSRYRSGKRLKETLAQMEEINQVSTAKNKLLEGVSYINDHIQNSKTLSALANNVIKAIVGYLEVPAGVLYVKEESKDYLEMKAGVAVSSKAQLGFKIGDGIIGNAALQKNSVRIKDVPIDYWHVETALGEVMGRGEILCMPLWLDNNLKGMIELGAFSNFSDQQKLLLENVAHNIAVAIHSQQASTRINALLAEVQANKENLVSQQEELRQTNEELSRQAEELQASEEELRTQEQELRQINNELIDKNTAVETAKQALMFKAQELENTSKYKSEFLANMSHELRTPLNSVLILAKLLSDNNAKNLTVKQVEYATIIHKSGGDLLQLINDILDLSKIEAGKIDLQIESVYINTIAQDLQQLFTVVALEKKINFEVVKEAGIPDNIKTDLQRTEQILKNLLSNAFKFTPASGTVTLTFSNRDQFDRKRIGISVTDSGIGISPEKQQLIFDAFQQADGSTSRKYGGTGLGLSISKELVRLLGGEIEVQSEEGKGSVFTIILPHESEETNQYHEALTVNSAPELANIVEQNSVEDDRNNLALGDQIMLIIEDDINFATIIKDFARTKGYKVIVALQGDEGLLYAKKYQPSAITLDIQLPVIDGWSLLSIFKKDPEISHIPVHIISAYDDNRLNTGGALAYVKKPIDKEGLDKAFQTIGLHLMARVKNVLLISAAHFKDDGLKDLFKEKHNEVHFSMVESIEAGKIMLAETLFDCIVVDIGSDIEKGVSHLTSWKPVLAEKEIPVIIYIDKDISATDELQLKKISGVIVRDSPAVNSRLKDELDLFLYKVEQVASSNSSDTNSNNSFSDISLEGKKILVVDDDMRNVFALSTVLETENSEVFTASDGFESIEMLQKYPDIDLVLMDIMMPEMDGYQAMEKIRNELKLNNLPIIALTAKAMAGDREKCIAAGASDYITKPVDIQKLFSLIRVWLSR